MAKNKKKNKGKNRNIGWITVSVFAVAIAVALIFGYDYYHRILGPSVKTEQDMYMLRIPTGSDMEDVAQILSDSNIIRNKDNFLWVAGQMNYEGNVHPGQYYLRPGMSNRSLVNLLRSGEQEPLNLVLNKHRTKAELAGFVSDKLEVDSAALITLLNDNIFLRQYGLNRDNVMAIFIPNTYEFYWNTDATGFFERMYKENERFWNEEREAKATKKGLTKEEVYTLASIIEEESQKRDERSLIAGVYLNRLNKGWKLQADPTVRFAIGDFSMQRILKAHTQHDSPYNTYKYKGLPPGPICIPSINSIDAVLNASDHDYLYFCAKEDFSGYHNFSKTLGEHLRHARNFQRELNRRKIYQ